jgi:threonine synthase
MSIWRWAELIDHVPQYVDSPATGERVFPRISLGEGGSPLIRSRRMGPALGLRNLFFKVESALPTGSYKDRFAAVGVGDLIARGVRTCIATSSGNTGAAVAAYCAIAGISCQIAILETAPAGKLKQMLAYGAKLYRVRGFGVDADTTQYCMDTLRRIAKQPGHALLVSAFSISPIGMSGVQTIAYELVEQFELLRGQTAHTGGRLGRARTGETLESIGHVFCPAGGGGLTLAVARGFARLVEESRLGVSPAVECVQPEGNDTIATPLRTGLESARAVKCTTSVSGLQVASVLDGHDVVTACRESNGSGHVVSDEEVWQTQKRLALEEGIFCEPAGAVALAGALKAVREKRISPDAVTVCLVTGSAFKDPPSLDRMIENVPCPAIDSGEMEAEFARASGVTPPTPRGNRPGEG